jgi:hypothetical protein
MINSIEAMIVIDNPKVYLSALILIFSTPFIWESWEFTKLSVKIEAFVSVSNKVLANISSENSF